MAPIKLYMTLEDQKIGLASYRSTFKRLGIAPTFLQSGVDGVMPLTDRAAIQMAGHQSYMPAASIDKILNRDRLHETGLPVLPTTVISHPDEAPEGAFVKPRNSVIGGYVFQPHIGFPHEDLDIHFSVNAEGRVYVIAAHRHQHLDRKKPGVLRMARPEEYVGVVEKIEAACKLLGIRCGLHDVAFLMHQGQWCAIDWNPRAPFLYTDGLAGAYPVLDGAIAHMLGLPMPEPTPAVFVNRPYWDRPIPLGKRSMIEALGLTPRRDAHRAIDGFVRVNGIGATESEVNAKFDQMESQL